MMRERMRNQIEAADYPGMTAAAVSNLLRLAGIIMVGAACLLAGLDVNPLIALGLAFIGWPILWFALCAILYWPGRD